MVIARTVPELCGGTSYPKSCGNQAFFLRHIAVNDATAGNLIPQKILNSRIMFYSDKVRAVGYDEFTALWMTSTPLVQFQILQFWVTSFSFFHCEALQLNIGRFTTRYKLKLGGKTHRQWHFQLNFPTQKAIKTTNEMAKQQ